ncbi:11830_t:CDS:2, partial [Racocetra fulgida]
MALMQVPQIDQLVIVDSAPIDARMSKEFDNYVEIMKNIEQIGVVKQSQADEIMKIPESETYKFRIPLDVLGNSLKTLHGFPFDPARHTFHKSTLFVAGT